MKSLTKFIVIAGLALAPAAPALAGYKLMPKDKEALITKTNFAVTPDVDWNRLGSRVGRFAESWTLDGLSLNDVTFYAGIADNTTLFREVNKKETPLPRFNGTMLPTDIAQLFEASYRIANKTSLFSVDSIEPATFAGKPGVHFTYTFTVQDEEVKRHGQATGAIIDKKLYLITYEAPVILYYGRDLPRYQALVASAQLKAAAAKR